MQDALTQYLLKRDGLNLAGFADPMLKDSAELLTKNERQKLTDKLTALSKKYSFDIVVHTTNSFGNMSAQEYAEFYYDSNSYGQNQASDGCIIVINIESREWYLSTCGLGVKVIDEGAIDEISEVILPSFKDDNFYEGFVDYADEVAERLRAYNESLATTKKPQPTTTAPTLSSQNTPFYALFVGAFKDRQNALNEAQRYINMGYTDTIVVVSTDWSNLNKERWYCVTIGTFPTKAAATSMLPEIQRECPSAYVKYSGDYQGN